jgi:hypothetical protein
VKLVTVVVWTFVEVWVRPICVLPFVASFVALRGTLRSAWKTVGKSSVLGFFVDVGIIMPVFWCLRLTL